MMEVINLLTKKGYQVLDVEIGKDDYTPDYRLSHTRLNLYQDKRIYNYMNEKKDLAFKYEYNIRIKPLTIDIWWGDEANDEYYLSTKEIIGKLYRFAEKLPSI